MNDAQREDVLAELRQRVDVGHIPQAGDRIALQHANAQCLRTLKGIAEEGAGQAS